MMDRFTGMNTLKTEEDKYIMCYMILRLIGQKEKEIWSEFVTNLCMKQQFNKNKQEIVKFKAYLEKEIPTRFNELSLSKPMKQTVIQNAMMK